MSPTAMRHWTRQIVFGDVDAMYASAAVVADPTLAGMKVAVGGSPPRGIITAASYPARRFGVRAAMPTAHALRLCPDLIVVPPDRPLYQRLHAHMCEVTERFFPITAWTSIDEFYADTTTLQALYTDPATLGAKVKNALLQATGLRCTIAIATSKTVAKIAADHSKPDGLAVIPPGTETAFLAPQSVHALPGIGPKTVAKVERLGIRTIGDLLDPRFEGPLRRLWGSRLLALQARARGFDGDPVLSDRTPKSRGHETTFDRDTNDLTNLEITLHGFLGRLAHELRVQGLAAGAFTVKLKDSQFVITTRHRHFSRPLQYDPPMWREIRQALHGLVTIGKCYRLVGLSLSNFAQASHGLYEGQTVDALAAMDTLIEKHGVNVIRLGGTSPKHF